MERRVVCEQVVESRWRYTEWKHTHSWWHSDRHWWFEPDCNANNAMQCVVDTITFTYCSLHTLEIMPNSAHVSGLHCLFVCGRQTLVNVCCMSIVDYAYTFAPPLGLQYMHYWCCCTRLYCCSYPPPIDSLSCSIIVEYSLQLGRYVYAWPITAAQHTLKNHSLHI